MRIYLDSCCFNRPLDDLTIERNRLEAAAIDEITTRVRTGRMELVGSDVLDLEFALITDARRHDFVAGFRILQKRRITMNDRIHKRGQLLETRGFKTFDAAHIACAEAAECDIFLSTDDRLLRRAIKNDKFLLVRVANPLNFLQE